MKKETVSVGNTYTSGSKLDYNLFHFTVSYHCGVPNTTYADLGVSPGEHPKTLSEASIYFENNTKRQADHTHIHTIQKMY